MANENEEKEAAGLDKFDIIPDEDDSPVDKEALKDIVENPIPSIYDKGWSEYALHQFEDDELIDGNPTVEGLRRVVGKLLGPVIRSVPVREVAPTLENNNRALVAWEIDILWQLDGDDDMVRTFGDVADVSEENTHADYAIYASATAATRAEGRALRKALQLRRVIAAEEVSVSASATAGKINGQQINFVNMMCERNDINVMKLIGLGKTKYEKIEDVPYAAAVAINKFLSECQNGKRNIPDAIKGYEPDWRK